MFSVELLLANPGAALKPCIIATVTVPSSDDRRATVSAVLRRGRGRLDDGGERQAPVLALIQH
jgi:hypothetical protein